MLVEPVWRYLIEWILTPYEAHMHGIRRVLYSGKTRYQQVDVVETYSFGKCLFLDGKLQSSEYDEYVYHEALVHPAMMTHPDPRRVLVIGGGEGATIREVLRYPSVERVVMVDLDKEVVDVCRRYMPEWSRGAFEDPRVELVIEEGRKFVRECGEEFDVVILDLTDPTPDSPSVYLYTREFYEMVKRRLGEEGVMVTQATSVRFSPKAFAMIRNTVAAVFPIARAYYTPVTSFLSLWGFVLGSLGRDPASINPDEIRSRLEKLTGELRYYDEVVHISMLHLPRYLRERLDEVREVATDENPAYMPP